MPSTRIEHLVHDLLEATPTICPERTLLYTEAFRQRDNRKAPACIRMARSMAWLLAHKTIRIHGHELLVGNYTSHRVGGFIAPEAHGIASLLELQTFPTRPSGPLQISPHDVRQLRRVIPFWASRTLVYQTHRSPLQKVRFLVESLRSRDWIINEIGGIGHFVPDYGRLVAAGTDAICAEARERQGGHEPGSERHAFYEATVIVCEGLAAFGERYAEQARRLAQAEEDRARRAELEQIAQVCARVPRHGARTLHEALQAVLLAQIAIVNEGLEVSICPGRMDQLLWPFYRADVEAGRLTREGAKELLACLCIKLSETVPVFAKLINEANSGLPSYQTLVVGGVDRKGRDAVNELSFIFLEIMDELGLRQPNFQARIHAGSPADYLERIYGMLAGGANTPALYNDDVIVPTLMAYGHTAEDARDYAPIGCVEPSCQGKSFASTDAALFNTPAVLELALNQGRRFGSARRTGAKTPPASRMTAMEDVTDAFTAQLRHQLRALHADLQAVEQANAVHHPLPLSSALLEGCLEAGRCATEGGAVYNRSGIQGVGISDVGDALCAIERHVFTDARLSLEELVAGLKGNLDDDALRARLRSTVGFGNDEKAADHWTATVAHEFADEVEALGTSTRGGRYVAALYSVTTHELFGRTTGALPNGRRRGEPYAAGIAPGNGRDREGPTAVINSMNRLDFSRFPNGINFNIKFQPELLHGDEGRARLHTLMGVYFERGGMQAQVNVLDAETLRRAKADPGAFPNLIVRVSGYSARFTDLSEAVQDEIIARTANDPGGSVNCSGSGRRGNGSGL